jgi:hypothetical protein
MAFGATLNTSAATSMVPPAGPVNVKQLWRERCRRIRRNGRGAGPEGVAGCHGATYTSGPIRQTGNDDWSHRLGTADTILIADCFASRSRRRPAAGE